MFLVSPFVDVGIDAALVVDGQASDEEDPFGHGGQLDEEQPHPWGVCGHAALHGDAVRSDEQSNEAIGPEGITRHCGTASLLPEESEDRGSLLGAHQSHVLTRTAHVVWCRVCGRHAALRLGIGLQRPFVG